MQRTHRTRSGIMLVELLVGLAVAAVVLALAARMTVVISVSVNRVKVSNVAQAERWNGVRLLAEMLRGASVPTDSQPFVGERSALTFDRITSDQSAWPFRDRVRLTVDDAGRLCAYASASAVVIRSQIARLEIDYLSTRGLASAWRETWVSTVDLPSAVRFRLTHRSSAGAVVDTVLMAVGTRL